MSFGPWARFVLRFGAAIGSAAWFLRLRRSVTMDGLRRAFPDRSEGERRALGRAAYRQLGRSLMEILLLRRLSDAQLESMVRFEGWDIYERARERGKGVVCAVAHFGNFELLPRAVARRGVQLSIIVRNLGDAFGRWLFAGRMQTGVRHLPDRASSRQALSVLRSGQVLAIAVDQNMRPSRGIFVEFFGSPACTTPAAAVFALRSGAALIAAFPVRQPDGSHVVQVRGPFQTERSGHAAVEELTQKITRAVEEEIRAHPDHWFWVHRRWKTRPA